MDVMDKANISKIKLNIISFRNKQPIWSFVISFVLYFILLHLLFFPLISYNSKFHSFIAESQVEKYVNRKFESSRQSMFLYDENKDILECRTRYYNKKNTEDSIVQKAITINMYLESFIPVIFLLSLFFAENIPFKEKIYRIVIAGIILNIYIILKVAALFFDNYSYPDFAIYDFEGITGNFVFYFNKLLKSTGNSINYILVAVIWISFGKFAQEMILKRIDK
jgi:hypothetical protein